MNILIVRPADRRDEILLPSRRRFAACATRTARLIFLSSAYAAPVLWHHPDIDEILTLEGGESLRDLVRLFRAGIHAALFLKPFRKLVVAAWLAGVPLRVGTGYRWYSWLLNRRVYEHRSDFSKHESLYNLGLLRGLGLSPGDGTPPRLISSQRSCRWAATFLGPPTTRIVVHPGGFSSRTWKAAQFRDLVWRLARDGYEILLTGSQAEGERFRSETGMTECPTGVRDLMGTLSLRELMAVMAQSQAVVSMSSGPMHLAAALGVPTISLFDPRRNQSPVRWQPLGRGVVLMPDVPTCEKCIYQACPYWDCLDRITVETVLQRIQQVLALGPSAPLAVGRV